MMDTSELVVMLRDLLQKVDDIKDTQSEIQQTLTAQAKDLEYHIRRTDLLDARVEQVANTVKPLSENRTKMQGVYAFLLLISLLVGIGVGVFKIQEAINDLKNISVKDR